MNESNKTLAFIGIACVACVVAYLSQPAPAEIDAADEIGKQLTKEFETEDAQRLKITRFDEDEAKLSNFEVAQVGRLWSIPSRGGYPADAQEQMAKAVDGVRGREILDVASKSAEDHEQFGVIDPNSPKLEVGQTGVGTHVTLADESGDALVDLVIGQPVKDGPGLHYVRRADQDFVYVVAIDPADFSTTFEDWIEDDLLNISPWDIKQVRLNDYSAQIVLAGAGLGVEPDYRTRMTLEYNDTDSKWSAVSLEKASNPRIAEYEAFELGTNEELNSETLNSLKDALDDLRIVDVARKPAGLSADLKAGDNFFDDNEALLSLIDRGFAPMENKELLSTSGELVCTMKDGVEYVLRFGDPVRGDNASAAPDASEESAEGINRYLFVMVRFNEALLEKPELEEVPELPAGVEMPEESPEEDSEESSESAEDDSQSEETKQLIAERKEIEQRNQRKQEEYDEKLVQGERKVAMLNERFGDWYYVVSGEVFSKISLGRSDVIKQAEGSAETTTEDAADNPIGAPGAAIPGLPNLSFSNEPAAENDTAPAEASEESDPAGEESADAGAATEVEEPVATAEEASADSAPTQPDAAQPAESESAE